MSERLPEQVDALRLARQRVQLQGTVSMASMNRLREYLCAEPGEALVDCEFGLGESNIGFLRGHIRAQLPLSCQRCLEPLGLAVNTSFAFGLIESEAQADRIGDDFEALVIGAEPLRLADLIEDELILALPIVALHEKAECPAAENMVAGEPELDRQEASSPFAVLEELKKH